MCLLSKDKMGLKAGVCFTKVFSRTRPTSLIYTNDQPSSHEAECLPLWALINSGRRGILFCLVGMVQTSMFLWPNLL